MIGTIQIFKLHEATFEFNGKTYNGVGRSKQRCVGHKKFMK